MEVSWGGQGKLVCGLDTLGTMPGSVQTGSAPMDGTVGRMVYDPTGPVPALRPPWLLRGSCPGEDTELASPPSIHPSLESVNICGVNRIAIAMFLTNYNMVFISSDGRLC